MSSGRKELAEQRDRAVATINEVHNQLRQVVAHHQKSQREMVQWIINFMLRTGHTEIAFDVADLDDAKDWLVQRENEPETQIIRWKLRARAEVEAEMAAKAEQARRDAIFENPVDEETDES